MPFEHSCFISYRHPNHQLGRRIVSELYEGLCSELELMTDKNVYLDTVGLEGGYLYNENLAIELYKSVCMIVIYTPTYFSFEHPYCSREYKAMEDLEHERLDLLFDPEDKTKGLIIPIVFRGFDRIPQIIKEQRQCYDFSGFLASDIEMYKHHRYSAEINKVAQYISNRCTVFDSLTPDPCAILVDGFSLPKVEDIKPWIQGMIPGALVFPGRETN